VKRAFSGLCVFCVAPRTRTITEVTVESAYRAGKPEHEARLHVRTLRGALWDIFASSAFRQHRDALREAARIRRAN
jgi:hypothetical protein